MNTIEEFIKRRFPEDCNWTSGNCYYFAKILESTFNGRIWYELIYGHFVCEIDGEFYDWNGKVKPSIDKKYIPWDKMEEYDSNVKSRIIRDCIL